MQAAPDIEVDHIDRNRLNNSRSNLRLCTKSQNHMNKPGVARPLPKGVYLGARGQRFRACIKVNRKSIHLGYFETVDAAVSARTRAVAKYHGEYAFEKS